MIKINWDDVITKLVVYSLVGIMALGLHLITTQAIEGYDELRESQYYMREDVNLLLEHHQEQVEEAVKPEIKIRTKIWRTVTFYEFRRKE